ncbi:endonuclease-reverse transcriptase [Elysia marginata]|uniref:Endonuclease-reverse transcriptase n=1 Tax=Elysia marginata TaxID=1093978 RepID=A0AAV4I4H0_9GAST|nr:endonuclease-reverse transcriptase [Elysia marginata]
MEALAKARIPSHERRLVCEIYWNQSAKVKLTSGTTEDIMIQRGVRQGCILSPSLFNLDSEYLLQESISEKSSILINAVNIKNIRYADDTVIRESEEQLQAMLDRIVDKCKEYGMEINVKKTKTVHIRRNTKTLTITVGNAVLEQVSKCSYLGHMITEDVATLKKVQMWIEKTRQKFWENIELLRRTVGLNTKKRILACYIFSVFNYGCEAWTYSKTVQKKIQTFEMWCYRRLLKVPWTEKKTNREIIQMADVDERLLQQLIKRKPRYAGHIMRGSSGPLLQLSLEGKIEGKRGQGRPRRNWMPVDGRCKGMVRVDKLWRYETEGREQRRMERFGCQRSDRRRHLIIDYYYCYHYFFFAS